MSDPFNLSSIRQSAQPPQAVSPAPVKPLKKNKGWFWVAIFSLLLVASSATYLIFNSTISADVEKSATKIQISGINDELNSSEELVLLVNITPGADYENASLVVYSSGMSFDLATLDGAKDLSSQDLADLSASAKSGFRYSMSLQSGKKRVVQLKSTVSSTSQSLDVIAKLYSISDKTKCGPLNLLTCSSSDETLLASTSTAAKISQTSEISIRKGWSIIGIPYLLDKSALKNLILSLQDNESYTFSPTTGEYIDLSGNLAKGKEDVLDSILPGKGILVYSSSGEKIALPTNKTATDATQEYKLTLKTGYNFLANPYSKERIIFSSSIMVQELSDDGTPTGQAITYKDAVNSGWLNLPMQLVQKTFTDSQNETSVLANSAEYQAMDYNTKITPFSGFVIEARKPVQIILSSDNLARADLLSQKRKEQIDKCLTNLGLDEYGNKQGTIYPDGAPLDSLGEKYINPLDSVIDKNLDKSC